MIMKVIYVHEKINIYHLSHEYLCYIRFKTEITSDYHGQTAVQIYEPQASDSEKFDNDNTNPSNTQHSCKWCFSIRSL